MIFAFAFVIAACCSAYAEVQNIKVSGDIESLAVFRNAFDLKSKEARNGLNAVAPSAGIGIPTDIVGTFFQQGTSSNFFLTQARVRVDADLTDNVSATLRLIGEWMWGKEDTGPIPRDSDTSVHVDLAYVTLKEFLYSPLTLIVGRQELHYGNDMIIGDPDTNMYASNGSIPGDLSKRKAFDAIRAILNYDPLVIDLVYSKINGTALLNTGSQLRFGLPQLRDLNGAYIERSGDRLDDDSDLFGINAKYDLGRKNTIVEGYYWYRRIGPRAYDNMISNLISPLPGYDYKSDQLHTFGARIATEPIENLTFKLEGAIQRGRFNGFTNIMPGIVSGGAVINNNHATRSAWALETMLNYTWKKSKYVPSLGVLYAYFSGEDQNWDWDNPGVSQTSNNIYRGWDPMFENQCFGHIANALMPQTGVQLVGLQASMKPKEDVTAKLEYYNYFATSANDSLNYMPIGSYYYSIAAPLQTKGNEKHLGQELDVNLTYDYTEDVQFNLLTGVFMPGGYFVDENARTASEVVGSMKVTF